ncbi:MAG: hypothetical protein VW739_04320 [Pelagibacteraceae bacterium]
MEYEIPDYRKEFGSYHNSASGGTQPTDEHILKLYLQKEHKMRFPMSARPRAGQVAQEGTEHYFGLHDYSPIKGQQEGLSLPEAIRHAMTEYMEYQPLMWDGGKDAEQFEAFKEYIPDMIRHAVHGIEEYFGRNTELQGEYQRMFWDERLDVPIIGYLDYSDETRELDLKCSLPVANPVKKDGTRTWRVPKPKTEPTHQQILQKAVYYRMTGLKPALLYVTAEGYNLCTPDNCEALSHDNLTAAYEEIAGRWITIQNLMRAAGGNWRRLFGMVTPDYAQISQRHGPEILDIAKQAWRIN